VGKIKIKNKKKKGVQELVIQKYELRSRVVPRLFLGCTPKIKVKLLKGVTNYFGGAPHSIRLFCPANNHTLVACT
jgi:hypothetical protein